MMHRPPLRIALLAPLWHPITADTRGGREQIVYLLARELAAHGHDITLIASGDSAPLGRLLPVCPHAVLVAMERGAIDEYAGYEAAAISAALRLGRGVDLVHSHIDGGFVPFAPLLPIPTLHTMHGMVTRDLRWLVDRCPESNFATVGYHQEAALRGARTVTTVQNGIDMDALPFCDDPDDYLLFLGRLDPIKGPHVAIEAAAAADRALVLAGPIANRAFFDTQIAPALDGRRVRYVGPVEGPSKRDVLRKARALLFPVQWDEPFGLVMVEAMACGTPVVALRRGAVPEVITPGVNGFYAEQAAGLPALVRRLAEIRRKDVRLSAEARFSHRRMAGDYLALYDRLLGAGTA